MIVVASCEESPHQMSLRCDIGEIALNMATMGNMFNITLSWRVDGEDRSEQLLQPGDNSSTVDVQIFGDIFNASVSVWLMHIYFNIKGISIKRNIVSWGFFFVFRFFFLSKLLLFIPQTKQESLPSGNVWKPFSVPPAE